HILSFFTPPPNPTSSTLSLHDALPISALIQLMLGGLPPSVDGGLLNARLRYFDPERRRAGVPPDVAGLVSEMTDTQTTATLVNRSEEHTSELQSRENLVCRLLLEKQKK